MKKKVLLLIMLFFMPFIIVNATEGTQDTNDILLAPVLPESEGSSFLAGDKVESNKNIDGILFAAGDDLNIAGSNEYGFYAGNTLQIDAYIHKDLFVAGNLITLSTNSSVLRDAFIAGNKIEISAFIGRNINATGNTIELSNTTIEGNVNLDFSNIEFKENVVINGVLKYNDTANVSGIENASIATVETYKGSSLDIETKSSNVLVDALFSMVSIILVGYVLFSIFPKLFKMFTKDNSISSMFKNMGIGLLTLISVPIASIILLLTRFGLGLGLLSLGVYVIFLGVSTLISASIIGSLIVSKLFKLKSNSIYVSILTGVVVIKIVSLIPFVGGLISFLLFLMGLGYIIKIAFLKKA